MTIKEFKVQLALGSLSKEDKVRLANNKRTSKKILTILSKDKDSYIRYWAAENPSTPIDILKILSTDKNSNVRYWVTCNPNVPIEVLKKLSKDKNSDVRHGVAVQILKEEENENN